MVEERDKAVVKVIYTIDVEGHDGSNPFETLVWGNYDNSSGQGIDKIMDLSDQFNIKALFFVDFAAAWDYGEEILDKVVNHILERGHDVGVHIHPDHIDPLKRRFLWEYSYEEQYDIILKCTQLYKKITGFMPKSFRAGRYSANNDTLSILSNIGYKYDFSEFYGQKWCKINPPIASVLPVKSGKLVEIPVTSFKSFKLLNYMRYDRLDGALDSIFFRNVIKKASKIDNIIISMFSHSFSFIDWRGHIDSPIDNEKEYIKTYNNFLYLQKCKDIDFISEQELNNIILEHEQNGTEFPIIDCSKNFFLSSLFLLRTAYSIRHANKIANTLVIAIGCFIVLVFIIVILLIFGVL